MDQRHKPETTTEERQQDVADSVETAIVGATYLVSKPIGHKIVEGGTGDPNKREHEVGSSPSEPVCACDLCDRQV